MTEGKVALKTPLLLLHCSCAWFGLWCPHWQPIWNPFDNHDIEWEDFLQWVYLQNSFSMIRSQIDEEWETFMLNREIIVTIASNGS